MNKYIFSIILVFMLVFFSVVYAEETEFERDPFEIQMPLPEPTKQESNYQQNRQVGEPVANNNNNSQNQTTTEQPEVPPKKLSLPSFKVKGLVWNSDMPQAIIDDQVYKEGDILPFKFDSNNQAPEGGNQEQAQDTTIKILSITREGVEVSFQGENHIIK
ncbi:MAG: hypothetical protein HQL25_05020 [Candidatus Omnitrophica bacterium]|nr:hypothetical protein [Candidatus Omnitrophota bacterium]